MTQPAYVTSINRRFHRITNGYCDAVKCRFGPKHAFFAVYCCLQDWSGGDRRSAMGVKTRDLTLRWDKKKSDGESGSGRLTSKIPISSRALGVGQISGLVTWGPTASGLDPLTASLFDQVC
jgi:hypothetical protein